MQIYILKNIKCSKVQNFDFKVQNLGGNAGKAYSISITIRGVIKTGQPGNFHVADQIFSFNQYTHMYI